MEKLAEQLVHFFKLRIEVSKQSNVDRPITLILSVVIWRVSIKQQKHINRAKQLRNNNSWAVDSFNA